MSKSAHLRIQDVRAILRVLGECRDLGDDPAAWQQHLCRSAGRLTGAGLAFCGEQAGLLAGRAANLHMESWGWENGFNQPLWFQVVVTAMTSPMDSVLMTRGVERLRHEASVAHTRTDLVSDREWEASADFGRVRVIGLNHTIGGFRPFPGARDRFSYLCLWRAAGERDFTPRDRVLLREVQAAIVPQVGGPLARPGEASPAELAPRVRQVLRCLLEGDGDKQIAARLGLSPHTVNQYTKAVFQHFGVQSRAELLARWVRRGFPGRFAWENE
jgi:DNA-binding CsgD family transcriptional regulator